MGNTISDIVARFNQPFPEKESFKRVVIKAFWVGLFITAFLYFFKPFGFQNARFSIAAYTIVFGLITFVTIILFEWVVSNWFGLSRDNDSWTLWKWMVLTLVLIFCISIGNYVFMLYLESASFSLRGLVQMTISTFVLGIFPTVVSGLLIQIKAIKKNEKQALQVRPQNIKESETKNTIKLLGQNADQFIEFTSDQLLFVEAQSNYVSIALSENQKLRKESIRNTIQNVHNQVPSNLLIRCHRSFLVNPMKIKSARGNAQGLRLTIEGLPNEEIPVSRSYIKSINEKLSSQNQNAQDSA